MSTYNSTPNRGVKIVVNLVSLALILFGTYVLVNEFVLNRESDAPVSVTAELPEPPQAEEIAQRSLQIDEAGIELTRQLKRNGFNMGFVWSGFIQDLGFTLPVDVDPQYRQTSSAAEYEQLGLPTPLEELAPAPATADTRNRLVFDDYEVDAPIIYASFEDIFLYDEEGNILLDQYVDNNPIESPVQSKLRDGIVHLPFTPSPGEEGNSYIIGHSSNYSSVESEYNFVFAPLIEKVSNGEDFVIYDNQGRELTFEVIDTKVVREEDVSGAYVKFDDKRTVTLQGSILEQTPDGILPTKRYLVTGELVVPEVVAEEVDGAVADPEAEAVLDIEEVPAGEVAEFAEEALQ